MEKLRPCPFQSFLASHGMVADACTNRAPDPAADSLDLIADAKRQGRHPDDIVMLNRQQARIIELVAAAEKLAEALWKR